MSTYTMNITKKPRLNNNEVKRVNFSQDEANYLAALLQHEPIVQSPKTDRNSVTQKKLAWNRITRRFNNWPRRSVDRTEKQLHKLWANRKHKLRCTEGEEDPIGIEQETDDTCINTNMIENIDDTSLDSSRIEMITMGPLTDGDEDGLSLRDEETIQSEILNTSRTRERMCNCVSEELIAAKMKFMQAMYTLEKKKSDEEYELIKLRKEVLKHKIAAFKAKESYYDKKKSQFCQST